MTHQAIEIAAPATSPTRAIAADLRRLLDRERLAAALKIAWRPQGHSRPSITHLEVERVHPARGGAFVLEIAVAAETPTGRLAERFHGELPADDVGVRYTRAIERLGDARRNQLSAGDIGRRVVLLGDLGLILRAEGLDERIPLLGAIDAPQDILQSALVSATPAQPLSARLLAHRYGKRAVLRILGADRQSAIVKLYKRKSDRSSRVARVMEALSRSSSEGERRLELPRLLAELPGGAGHVMEDVGGTSLYGVDARRSPESYRLAGAALASLHSSFAEAPDHHMPADEITLLDRWVDLAGATFPEHAARLSSALREARRALQSSTGYDPALIHRDFHEKQIVLRGGSAVMIDFDTACLGDPAQDLGNFLAHLELRELLLDEPADAAKAAFLAGYGRGDDRHRGHRTEVHRIATLLRLACLNLLTTHRQEVALALLERVNS